MKHRPSISNLFWLVALVSIVAPACAQRQQQFANLGDIKLQSRETLRDCRIGYRTYGKLNAEKSNAILFPTWAGGTTEQLQDAIVKDRFADPDALLRNYRGRAQQRHLFFALQQPLAAAHEVSAHHHS